MKDKFLVLIAGPTAVGKTAVAIELAEILGCPIISADSRQVFRELGVAVAKPTDEQLAKVKHYLIGHRSVHEPYNAAAYAVEAHDILNKIYKTGNIAILCGGTGLYIKAVTEGFDILPGSNEELRKELNELFELKGLEGLQLRLQESNPEIYSKSEILNPQRVMRAIEIAESADTEESGKTVSSKTSMLPEGCTVIGIGIELEREVLNERINNRVDEMVANGLEAEAREFYPLKELNALQTVGYNEWFSYWDGEILKTQVVSQIKQNTRRYAKRQMTWFKNKETLLWFSPTEIQSISEYITKTISLQTK